MGAIGLEIEQLMLDAENPRFVHGSSQRDILQKVLDDQQEKLYALAESIVESGMNPMDRLLVVREKPNSRKFVVLEGNRRVAALRILSNPTVLTGLELKESLRKRFEKLARDFRREEVEPITCFDIGHREDGMSWILLRHTGENDGQGVVGWSGLAASRFKGSDPALQALELVRNHSSLNDEERAVLDRNDYPITTLDRLLSSKEVRELIGIDVKERKLASTLPPEEFMKPLRRMVLDLGTRKINVSQLKNKAQQTAYVGTFDSASRPNLKKKGKLRVIDNIPETEFRDTRPRGRTSPRKADPSERKTVVPRAVKLNVQDNKLASILRELRGLKVEEFPNAAAVLLRVFLELSVDHYMQKHKLPAKYKDPSSGKEYDKTLKKKLEEVIAHVVAQKDGSKKDFDGVLRALSVRHSPLNIDLLHGYVHNRFVVPKRLDLTGAWDEAQPLFERIWA